MRPLGRSAFGAVYLVFKKDTGAPMATKKMMKPIIKQKNMIKDALIEREVLEKVKSPFLVNLLYAWQNKDWVGLVLTLCPGGDLFFQIQQQFPKKDGKKDPAAEYPGFQGGILKYYAASMALGLSQIHKAGFVYRDLKPQNVLLDIEGRVRISDMGLTCDISGGPIKQCSGTRGYWSPETIKKEPYTTQPDWWSLGCTIYVLNTDKLPFGGGKPEEIDARTCAGTINYNKKESQELQDLINGLCTVDQSARLCCGTDGVDALKGVAWFAGFDWDALKSGKMQPELVPNPNDINAPSAKEVEGFVKPEGVTWDESDQAKLANWDYVGKDAFDAEAIVRIKKMGLDGGGGGGGCCTIA